MKQSKARIRGPRGFGQRSQTGSNRE